MQRTKNFIEELFDEKGNVHCDLVEIKDITLFSSSGDLVIDEILDCVQPKVLKNINNSPYSLYRKEEFEKALKQMHPIGLLAQMG